MATVPPGLDPFFYANYKYKHRSFDECIEICNGLLAVNPYDQAFIDDSDWDEEGIGEVLLDDNAIAQAPRPGTSLTRPMTAKATGSDAALRPMTASGRPITGFARPGTSTARIGTGSSAVDAAFKGNRPGTSRAMTALGRAVRLGTASMLTTPGGPFVNVDKLDLKRYAARPAIAKALCDYILYVDHNPRKAMELAAAATVSAGYGDWWWKLKLGKCYFQLGLLRDAEKQLKSSLRQQDMVTTYLELAKVYVKLDQPAVAHDIFTRGCEAFPGDTHLLLGSARIHNAMNEPEKETALYKKVLTLDASNVEAIACLASHHFYSDQPEVALKYYRRLLQMGLSSPELWTNLGLCCFFASQYDMTLSCFDRALALAEDDAMGDVWYNVGHIAIGVGDVSLAYQAFRVAISVDASHAEAYNNLGVLEMRKGNIEAARTSFITAARLADYLFEPLFNAALLAYKAGDLQESYNYVQKALINFPEHSDGQELLKVLKSQFIQL